MNGKPNILIVDDDVSTIEIVSMILRSAGYDIMADTNGDLEFLQTSLYPDLILLDNHLGDKCGASICFYLKNNAVTKHIPIILASGIDDLDDLAAIACADDYLSKPFSIKLLLAKVEALLSQKAIAC